jgi:hypothetical protein
VGVNVSRARHHGLLLSGPLVRSFLDDGKTVTRRLITKQNSMLGSGRWEWIDLEAAQKDNLWGAVPGLKVPTTKAPPEHCPECVVRLYPRVEVGDLIWFRETWYCDDYRVQKGPYVEVEGARELLYYKASDDAGGGLTYTGFSGETMHNPWHPSIHMPKWVCRCWAKVTSVRPERVQEITPEDCYAEGVVYTGEGFDECVDPRLIFEALWDSLNAHRAPWASNPWVWRYEFERTETP